MSDDMAAIPFVRRTSNERVDGTLTVKIDIEPMYKLQFLKMFPDIGAEGAIAALSKGIVTTSKTEEAKEKPGPLCVLACQFCDDPIFWTWINTKTHYSAPDEFYAKEFIISECHIGSRKDLDTDERAASIFHSKIRKPFMAWRDQQ
jgi:hypothetical protein